MYFEAESNDTKYEVNVNETRTTWKVSIKAEDQDWINYEIPKLDYQRADDTISLIFNNSSYLVDVVGHDTEYNVYTRGSFRTVRIFNEEKLLHESLKKAGILEAALLSTQECLEKLSISSAQRVRTSPQTRPS